MLFDPRLLRHYRTLCRDGTYSRSKSRSACSWHGGVKEFGVDPPMSTQKGPVDLEAHPSAVYLVPLNQIGFDRKLFQNRKAEYSEESVNRILQAVEEGTFRFEVFDPILLWKRADGSLVVLSGHSRTEAFKRLSAAGNRTFDRIPAKIIEATQEQARKIALESNTLSTKETDTERVAYYRMLREQEVRDLATKNEGNNARRILAYSYLNPNGKTFFALTALEGKDATSQENVKNVANWIGNACQRFPMLSNIHEDEMFDFLVAGGYGRRYTNMRDFLQKVQAIIYQRTEFGSFDPDRPLNLTNMATPTHGEQQYNAMRSELLQNVREIERTYQDKLKMLNARGASQVDRDRILRPLEMSLRTARQKLVDFEQRATKPGAAAKQELNLFAVSGTRGAFRFY